ncbi:MAG: hypothetical protein WCI65_08250 [Synechococcaceae cyanobacterium ELA263]
MATGTSSSATSSPSPVDSAQPRSGPEWLSLTELGRIYGISAVHTGKLLGQAGLRQQGGRPSTSALEAGLALCQHPDHHHQALWSRQDCAPHLERQGLEPLQQRNLVGLWADLLSALQQGSPAISVSAEEMASDVPRELVRPVNRALRDRGCSFQVKQLRVAAGSRPACSPAPATDAGAPRRCG